MNSEDLDHVNMHEAKTHLSKLVERVEAGEEIVIDRAGKPVAKLVSLPRPQAEKRKLGGWEGKIWISPDFDERDEEFERLFYGGEPPSLESEDDQ